MCIGSSRYNIILTYRTVLGCLKLILLRLWIIRSGKIRPHSERSTRPTKQNQFIHWLSAKIKRV